MSWQERLKKVGITGIATAGFVGFAPFAPGTFGSVVGLAVVWWLRHVSLPLYFGCFLAVTGLGVWASHHAGKWFGEIDSGHIVIDEVAGMMLTMLGIPVTGYWLFWGFLLFRLFDVLKPPPANLFDQYVKNAWGVMLDDTAAGIYGTILLHLMVRATI